MNALSNIDMMEATRLAREGRLDEAMAVLRGALTNVAPSDVESDARNGREPPTPPILDFLPPSIGRSWGLRPANHTYLAGNPKGWSHLRLSESLRGFIDHLGHARAARGAEGMVSPGAQPSQLSLPDGAQFEEHIFSSEVGSRAYKLYIPSGYKGQRVPLVVMLHGCTQSPDDFAAGTRMNDLAEQQIFLVAYPAQPSSANASKCWNWFSAGDQQRDGGEPSLIAGITNEIMRAFPVERGRVYVAGLSAGGAAGAILGVTYPDLYAAVGVHSGLACGVASDLPSAFAAMRQGGSSASLRRSGSGHLVPTIVFHGDRDTTVNPVNGDQVIAQSKVSLNLGSSVRRGEAAGGISFTCTTHFDESGRSVLEQWVLHGAGHAWSGGNAAGSFTEPRGPDASREMLRFFLQHPRAARPWRNAS